MFRLLTVWACVAAIGAQALAAGRLSTIGAEYGGRVGSDIGGGFGSALDAGVARGSLSSRLVQPGIPAGPLRPGPVIPVLPGYSRDEGYSSGGGYGRGSYQGGSSSSDRRGYGNQSSGSAFEKGQSFNREKTVSEREQGAGYESGRSGQGSSRGGSSTAHDQYGRDSANYGNGYDQGYNSRTLL